MSLPPLGDKGELVMEGGTSMMQNSQTGEGEWRARGYLQSYTCTIVLASLLSGRYLPARVAQPRCSNMERPRWIGYVRQIKGSPARAGWG